MLRSPSCRFSLPACIALLAAMAVWLPRPAAAEGNPLEGNPLDGLERLKGYTAERASSADPDWRNGNADSRLIQPGKTQVLADLKGPGEIVHIWNTVAAQEPLYSRLLRLRIYWDGEKDPSVDCPLGDFFAAGHGIDVPLDSLPVRVTSNGRGRNCYWPMPFRKSARVTLTNEGRKDMGVYWYVDWQKRESIPADSAYFHAEYRQAYPAPPGRNYIVADIRGRGHYVGTVLSVRTNSGQWWGEGDDLFFVDGAREPGLRGTGTEDYFCDGWGFVKQSGPYYGAPVWEGNEADGGHTTVYRWHIPDPVPFTKSLRLEFEHKGVTFKTDGSIDTYFGERADDFSSVAFWYQAEPHKPFAPMPLGYKRLYDDPADVIEGEGLLSSATASGGAVERQEMAGERSGAQLLWKPESPGQALTVPFQVGAAGLYDLTLMLTRSWDYGIYQVELDGKPLGGPLDLYSPTIAPTQRRVARLRLSAGRHELRFVNKGRSEQSTGYLFGLDGILPTRL